MADAKAVTDVRCLERHDPPAPSEPHDATAARRGRLLEAASACGKSAAVVYSPALHSMLAMDGVWWATGFKPLAESAVGIAPDGSMTLWLTPCWDGTRAEEVVGDRAVASSDVFADLAAWRKELGLGSDDVLFCGADKVRAGRYEAAVGALGEAASGSDGGDRLLAQLARPRDERQRAAAADAVRIAEAAHAQLLEQLRPGLAEFEVVAMLDSLLRDLGSEDNFVLVSASQRNRSVHPPTNRTVERGDVLLAEVSPSVDGIFTQICRTVTIGASPDAVRNDFSVLDDALDAGLAACAPGTPVKTVTQAMDAVLTEAGFGDYCKPPYMRARGHGLGVGSVLPGDVTSTSEEVFEEGDYFVLHPNQFLPASGYLLCGEPVIVEASGARALSARRGELVGLGA